MSYKLLTIPPFEKQLKRLIKKYPSLKKEIANFSVSLIEEPKQGKYLGNNCYKIRLAIAAKGKGKSGGARIITCIQITQTTVYLLSIYDKSENDNLSDSDLHNLLGYMQ